MAAPGENWSLLWTGIEFQCGKTSSKGMWLFKLSSSIPVTNWEHSSDTTVFLFSIMLVTIYFRKTWRTFLDNSCCSERRLCLYLSFFFFCKINGAGVAKLMKQLPNCRGHWCVESYKLARSCGKLPSTSIEILPFLNSSSRQEKKQFKSKKEKCELTCIVWG